MLKSGLTEKDLFFKEKEEFEVEGLTDAIIDLRYEKHLNRVAEAIAQVRQDRRTLVINQRKAERERREFEKM